MHSASEFLFSYQKIQFIKWLLKRKVFSWLREKQFVLWRLSITAVYGTYLFLPDALCLSTLSCVHCTRRLQLKTAASFPDGVCFEVVPGIRSQGGANPGRSLPWWERVPLVCTRSAVRRHRSRTTGKPLGRLKLRIQS